MVLFLVTKRTSGANTSWRCSWPLWARELQNLQCLTGWKSSSWLALMVLWQHRRLSFIRKFMNERLWIATRRSSHSEWEFLTSPCVWAGSAVLYTWSTISPLCLSPALLKLQFLPFPRPVKHQNPADPNFSTHWQHKALPDTSWLPLAFFLSYRN